MDDSFVVSKEKKKLQAPHSKILLFGCIWLLEWNTLNFSNPRRKYDEGAFKEKINLQTNMVLDLMVSIQNLIVSSMRQEIEWQHQVET